MAEAEVASTAGRPDGGEVDGAGITSLQKPRPRAQCCAYLWKVTKRDWPIKPDISWLIPETNPQRGRPGEKEAGRFRW